MKYVDVPKGHYEVLAVFDRYRSQIAVIRREPTDGASDYDQRDYFLVTDLAPNMTEESTFAVGGTQ